MEVRTNLIGCFIIRKVANEWQILQILRAVDDFMGNTWTTVGGTSEDGERMWEAALRELREETGLTPAEFYQLDRVNTFFIAKHDALYHGVQFCAILAADASVTLNEEHTDHRWMPLLGSEAHFLWPGEHLAIEEIIREIVGNGPTKKHLRIEF